MIYLDYSATSPLLPEVHLKMDQILNLSEQKLLGNPSSLHSVGSLGRDLLTEARNSVSSLISARPSELIFTSGGSESNNTVINIFRGCPIFVSAIEHPSVLKPAEELAAPCIKIPVNKEGTIDLEFLETSLKETIEKNPKQKILVSVQLANNEVGTLEPVKAVSDLIKDLKSSLRAKIYLHTDATQAVGKIPVSVKDLGVDYLTFSCHKLGGPVGIGALFVRTGAPFRPLIFGGAQENHRRAGTSNILLASAFGAAANLAEKNLARIEEVKDLKNFLEQGIKARIKTAKIITPRLNSLPNVLTVAFPAAEGESTQLYLDLAGFAVSTGSACASGDLEPSHVLMAMYHDAEVAHGSVRFSLGLDTRKKEIEKLLAVLPGIIEKIQSLSTLKVKDKNEQE